MADIDIPFGLQDKAPIVRRTLELGGLPVDLTGATVTFLYRKFDKSVPQVIVPCSLIDPPNGIVQFQWPGEAAGLYRAQFYAVLGSGLPMHFPNNRLLTVEVMEEP